MATNPKNMITQLCRSPSAQKTLFKLCGEDQNRGKSRKNTGHIINRWPDTGYSQ